MLTHQKFKSTKNKKKILCSNLSHNNSQSIKSSLFKNFNIKKINLPKTRNISLINENISFSMQLNKKLNSIYITKLSNKHSRNKSLITKVKNGLRNQKIIDYSTHFITELNDNTNNKNSADTTTTANTSKRNFQNSKCPNIHFINNNLPKINCKLKKEKFSKIRNKICNNFNLLRGTSLHFHNKSSLEEYNIITEESIFNSKNSSSCQNKSTSKKSLKNINVENTIDSFDKIDISYTYSDDTDTKRFQNSKKKLNEYFENNLFDKQISLTRNYNNQKNNFNLTYNINKNNLNLDNNNEDFLTFCEEMNKKIFGK